MRTLRPIVYDATHLVSRLDRVATTGIDRVDLAYGRHFATHPQLACGLHCGLRHPHLFSPARVVDIVEFSERRLGEFDKDSSGEAFAAVYAWLTGYEKRPSSRSPKARPPALSGLARQIALRFAHDKACSIPAGAVYLNIAQHILEYPLFFEWLAKRRDVRPVFLVHDLLPLDYPEFFRPGYEQRFQRRVDTILRYAAAVITTSTPVAQRVAEAFAANGRRGVPIHVQALASPLERADLQPCDDALSAHPYFVVASTLEPRKNHMLLLNLWRSLVERGGAVPKLVMVGLRGWESEQTRQALDRSPLLAPHVRATSGLSSVEMGQLIGNARALLMPSFAEGYGLPVVEALGLGAPVIASDIPVFHEVAQECATFLSPIDGIGWRDAIMAFSDAQSERYAAALRWTKNFAAPNWQNYFEGIEAFLETL